MWNLYRTLKDGLQDNPEKYLIDEVTRLMDKIDTESFVGSLRQMYGDTFNEHKNPLELALMFVRGLKSNSFFEFHEVIRTISGSSQSRIS